MLEHIIERARAEGFQRFVIAVHYLAEMIENYFGDGSPLARSDRILARGIASGYGRGPRAVVSAPGRGIRRLER